MRDKFYEKIRDMVLDEATSPATSKEENKALANKTLEELCRPFDPKLPPEEFWYECWTHFRWAGIKASIGSRDVKAHEDAGVFEDFNLLCLPEWNYLEKIPQKNDGKYDGWGKNAKAYLLGKEFPYNTKGIIKNRQKLKKTIMVARALNKAVDDYGTKEYLRGIFGEDFYEDFINDDLESIQKWVESYCNLIDGDNTITTFHLLTDLGFNCVKPDIVLTDLFYRLGWLKDSGLPEGLDRKQIRNRYRDKSVYTSVQRAAREIAKSITPLHGNNAIRELDWIFVKYGQEPEPNRGILTKLDDHQPIEDVFEQFKKNS